jgi:hypothetical protein
MKKSDVLRSLISNLLHDQNDEQKGSIKIFVGKNLGMSKDELAIISRFCKYCVKYLQLVDDYKCYISSDRRKSRIKTTGICKYDDREIKVYGSNRALADVLRSIAHEMFHLRQGESNLIPRVIKNKHYSEPLEWHANAAAGSLLSKFASDVGRDKIYR